MPDKTYATPEHAERAADLYFNNQEFHKALKLYFILTDSFPNNISYKQKHALAEAAVASEKITLKKAALAVYKPPFRYQYGYIYDADNQVVADNNITNDGEIKNENGNLLLWVRGWGHIQKIKGEYKPEDIQDEIGRLIAEGLTKFWNEEMS